MFQYTSNHYQIDTLFAACWFLKVLNAQKPLSRWPSGLRLSVRKRRVADSIPGKDIYIYFHSECFAYFPFLNASTNMDTTNNLRSPCKWNQAWPLTCSVRCFNHMHIYYRSIALTKRVELTFGWLVYFWRLCKPQHRFKSFFQETCTTWYLLHCQSFFRPICLLSF